MNDTDTFRYPVIVEYTNRHVVWVDADNAELAAREVGWEPWKHTDDNETLFDSGNDVRAPQGWSDWADVYSGGYPSPYDPDNDAHVQTHRTEMYRQQREVLKAACAEAGHPHRNPHVRSDGTQRCQDCDEYVPANQVEAGAR